VENIETMSDEQIAAMGFMTRPEIKQMVQALPGSYWYMWGEVNRYVYMTPTRFAPVFKYFSSQIRAADPTAKIIAPSLLNWDFTCIGCLWDTSCGDLVGTGYRCGKSWVAGDATVNYEGFISAYESRYGEKPPVDVWSIDLYPIDWENTPNNDPEKKASFKGQEFMHWEIVVQQLQGMRQYLDTLAEYVDTPIWINEIAIHVGYDDWKWDPYPQQLKPVGDYNWDKMSDYLIKTLDWLEANAASHKIEKWFFFTTYRDIKKVGPDGYMGIIFFDGPQVGASLNCLGELYRSRSLQYLDNPPPKVKCDAIGKTVPE
jgi:hypothetical protein